MALPLPPGLTAAETAFLCQMESVTVIPRQRFESMNLLSGPTPPLRPPHRVNLPLWLALLLKKQKRANIVPPPWLHPTSLTELIHFETSIDTKSFSPPPPPPVVSNGRGGTSRVGLGDVKLSAPFLDSCTVASPATGLPYHWQEFAEILLAQAADDVPQALEVRGLLMDLQEVRAAKLRASMSAVELVSEPLGGVIGLRGMGGMELAENRAVVSGIFDGIRKLGATTEAARRARGEGEEDEDEDMDDELGL